MRTASTQLGFTRPISAAHSFYFPPPHQLQPPHLLPAASVDLGKKRKGKEGLIRPPAASRSLLDHRGRHPQPRIALELAQDPGGRPSWRLVGNFLGQPKESFTKPFDPFGVYLKGKYPTHNVPPWLREVGVAERRPVRTSRDVTSGRSSRPRHRKVLYFPHRLLWIMEYSCKVWCKPCRPGSYPGSTPGSVGGSG
ncbi:hypothetical protein Taro_009118 [Colocasia esculenta]|uniref:Uncharacterized protein n=1 Tax=Colocasia esculenta TaxID=4460 RepID=A0A843U3W6_COLES|nr:hypothetical protein [Colocasia esculenta]